MSGQALGLTKQRKEKLSPDLKGKIAGNPKRKVELGYLRIPKGLGSLGYATGPSWDWDISKEHAQEHKEQEQMCPISHPMMQKRNIRLGNQ